MSAAHEPTADCQDALETLGRVYWYPLYAFARRVGRAPEDAADLTQEFFARLLDKGFLQSVDREKGRFRTFLLVVFKRFLANEHQRQKTIRRGGHLNRLPIDTDIGEQRYTYEPTDHWSAEALFERRWALTLLEQVVQELKADYEQKGKLPLFECCKPFLTGNTGGPPYADVARQLDMTESAVRVAVHRMRDRYREVLKREVAHTLGDASAIEDELNHLKAAVIGPRP